MMRKRAEDIITYELSKETRAYERSKNGGAIAVFLSSSACLEEKSCISYLTNTTEILLGNQSCCRLHMVFGWGSGTYQKQATHHHAITVLALGGSSDEQVYVIQKTQWARVQSVGSGHASCNCLVEVRRPWLSWHDDDLGWEGSRLHGDLQTFGRSPVDPFEIFLALGVDEMTCLRLPRGIPFHSVKQSLGQSF